MLHLHRSNHYESLRAACLHSLQRSAQAPDTDPLAALTVVVPNQAVLDDLRRAWADQHGVAAGLDTPFLGQWLWPLAMRWVPNATQGAPVAAQRLVWPIWHALCDTPWVAQQPRLGRWLASRDASGVFELAQHLAELFERYANHRHEWLTHWATGPVASATQAAMHPDAAWQAALWRRLAQALGLDREHPFVTALKALQAGRLPTDGAGLPPSLQVFMPGAMPPLHVDFLHALALHTEVHVYLLDPSRAFWYDTVSPRRLARLKQSGRAAGHEVGHELLNPWGAALRDSLAKWQDPPANLDFNEKDHHQAPTGLHRLAQLQRSILELTPLDRGSLVHESGDRSLEVHIAHSLTRQAETLHDRLLDLLGQDRSLQLDDIVVLVPQLADAAPLIDAAFAGVPDAMRLPWQIVGQSGEAVSPCAQAMLALLQMAQSRLPGPTLTDWLHHPAVSAAWQLSADAIDALATALQASGHRWGWDAQHRAQVIAHHNDTAAEDAAQDADEVGTLDHALQRLLLRHCVGPSTPSALPGLAAAPPTAGLEPEQLARLWPELAALRDWCAQARQAHTLPQWMTLLQQAFGRWIGPGPQPGGADAALWRDAQALAQSLRDLGADAGYGTAPDTAFDAAPGAASGAGSTTAPSAAQPSLPASALAAVLRQRWQTLPRGASARGAITVAPLSALAGLPFRVVAVLGLDDGALGANRAAAELDLMAEAPAAGDPHSANTDRQHLLMALLGARDMLWLSYSGRTPQDHTERAPSVVLAELIAAVLGASTGPGGAQLKPQALHDGLVVEHPAQAFSPRAFLALDASGQIADGRLHSHRFDLLPPAAQAPQSKRQAEVATAAGDEPEENDSEDEDLADPSEADAEPALAGPRFVRGVLPAPSAPPLPTLELSRLQGLWADPATDFARHRLGLDLPKHISAWPDTEPLAEPLGAAHWWATDQQALLDQVTAWARTAPGDVVTPQALQHALARSIQSAALLPHSQDRAELAAQAQARLWPALHAWWGLGGHRAQAQPLALALAPPGSGAGNGHPDRRVDTFSLRGGSLPLGPCGAVQLSAHAAQGRHLLKAWIAHLAHCAAATNTGPTLTWLIDLDGLWLLNPPDHAGQLLQGLLDHAHTAEAQPLPFFAHPQWIERCDQRPGAHRKAWDAEARRPATQLVWRGHADLRACASRALADEVLAPLLGHAQRIDIAALPAESARRGLPFDSLSFV